MFTVPTETPMNFTLVVVSHTALALSWQDIPILSTHGSCVTLRSHAKQYWLTNRCIKGMMSLIMLLNRVWHNTRTSWIIYTRTQYIIVPYMAAQRPGVVLMLNGRMKHSNGVSICFDYFCLKWESAILLYSITSFIRYLDV